MWAFYTKFEQQKTWVCSGLSSIFPTSNVDTEFKGLPIISISLQISFFPQSNFVLGWNPCMCVAWNLTLMLKIMILLSKICIQIFWDAHSICVFKTVASVFQVFWFHYQWWDTLHYMPHKWRLKLPVVEWEGCMLTEIMQISHYNCEVWM